MPPARALRNVSFEVEVKFGRTPQQDRARVARVVEWDNGRVTKQTWFLAEYVPGYHDRWDYYRAEKLAYEALRAAQAIGGAL